MTTFSVNQSVTVLKDVWTWADTENYRNLKGETFVVKSIEIVPPEEIEYNPYTYKGGVGHKQWLIFDLDGEKRKFSGFWFEKE